jgi:hypothetical protein
MLEGGVKAFLYPVLVTLWRMSSPGFRANLVPGLVLWSVGLGIVLSYYFLESSRGFFEAVMETKQTNGFLYSFVATGFFGGLVPFLYLWAAGRINAGMVTRNGAFFILFWGARGIDVDAFYRLQSLLFGDDLNWTTIATKVFVDQFVYCTLWAAPITAVFYGWKDCGFSWSKLRKTTTKRSFLFEVARLLLSTWLVWIPATAIIYSLPQALQVPLFSLTLCFFVLLVSVFSRKENRS